jgi:hypothetical protein
MCKLRILLIGSVCIVCVIGLWLALSSSSVPSSVIVSHIGIATNETGPAVFTFQITNAMTEDLIGHYAGEVFTDGCWQNASPQISGAGELLQISAHKVRSIAVSAPSDDSKWRVVFSYSTGEPRVRARIRQFLRIGTPRRVAFSHEIAP